MMSDPVSAMLKYLPPEVTIAISQPNLGDEIEYKEVTIPTRDVVNAFMKLRMSYLKCSLIR